MCRCGVAAVFQRLLHGSTLRFISPPNTTHTSEDIFDLQRRKEAAAGVSTNGQSQKIPALSKVWPYSKLSNSNCDLLRKVEPRPKRDMFSCITRPEDLSTREPIRALFAGFLPRHLNPKRWQPWLKFLRRKTRNPPVRLKVP
jgi:hypothetical protein